MRTAAGSSRWQDPATRCDPGGDRGSTPERDARICPGVRVEGGARRRQAGVVLARRQRLGLAVVGGAGTLPGVEMQPTCPHARRVEGAEPGAGGIICGVIEADENRADSILEGTHTGPFLRERDDPSMIAHLCCGTEPPSAHPDSEDASAHYTSCPYFRANVEIRLLGDGRTFAAPDTSDPGAPEHGAFSIGDVPLTDDERRAIGMLR